MLNLPHCMVHGGDKIAEVNHHSEQILDELEKEFPAVFSKPMYPIWEHQQIF